MTTPTGDIRQLKYPLNRVDALTADTPDTPEILNIVPDWSTTDSDERIFVVLNLSLNEFVALATSIDVGSNIAYGDNWLYIWWIWVRSFMSTDFCALMIDCINNDSDVRDALFNALQFGVPASGDDGINETIANGNVLAGVECDNDQLFGAITGLVDLMNNLATDILLRLSSESNTIGIIGDVIEAIPGINNLSFDDALQMVEAFWDHLLEDYDAYYDTALRDTYRCDLFCLAKDTCTITPQDFFDYFTSKLGEAITTISLIDFLQAVLLQDFSGVYIVHAFHVLISGLWLFGASILSIDSATMARMVNALFNDPDSDWDGLCDCPSEWSWNDDFANDQNIWNITNLGYGALAVWTSTIGYEWIDGQTASGSYSRIIRIETDEFAPTQINHVEFRYNMTKGLSISTATALSIQCVKDDDTIISQNLTFTSLSNGSNLLFELDLDEPDIKLIRILFRCWTGVTEDYAGDEDLLSVNVQGEGFNPFE